ncbi:hypothetical protein LzC2_30710 [Planctomycetes bacterium LzC2]|uniref:Phytanoyl-CoA dioxygenase n=1 Tax=Alienimonas chondri TaxID=2681879 RepID=A0ABX1VGR2_9PLAN|nr:hypothetical protein [Alienimonas chondri]
MRRLKNAFARGPVFTRLLTSEPVRTRLGQLIAPGETNPEVIVPLAHHNCVMTKQPRFSSDTGWHQDVRYWSFARPDLVNLWIALGDETPENGCLRVIPGTHAGTSIARASRSAFSSAATGAKCDCLQVRSGTLQRALRPAQP